MGVATYRGLIFNILFIDYENLVYLVRLRMSLFERLGGEAAISTAVDIFYKKMLSDGRVKDFFAQTDMERQISRQKHFLMMVTGGPNHYEGKSMRDAHKHLVTKGLSDLHVDVVIEHLGATLRELGAKEGDIAEVAALANSVRDDVLNR